MPRLAEGERAMPLTKYDIPVQVDSWDDLNTKYTQAEIVGMCDQYLRSRIRASKTRASQQAEIKAYRAFKKSQQAGS